MKIFDKPKFITFEGGEGSGKSTQSKMLYEYLISNNVKAIHTREVGGTPEAEEIRDLLVHRELYPMSELMLVMAARYEHINKVIIPALNDGTWVICDRFIDSTACYQSNNLGLNIEDIFDLHNKLMKSYINNRVVMPDITFFMDLPPQIGMKRSFESGDLNKFEDKEMLFHQMVYEKFKTITAKYPARIKSLNCIERKADKIHQEIIDFIF